MQVFTSGNMYHTAGFLRKGVVGMGWGMFRPISLAEYYSPCHQGTYLNKWTK